MNLLTTPDFSHGLHDEDRLGIIARQVRRRWANRPAPTCTLIPVPRLALDGMLFEIEAEAYSAWRR